MSYNLKFQDDCNFYLCPQKILGVNYRKGDRKVQNGIHFQLHSNDKKDKFEDFVEFWELLCLPVSIRKR